MSKKSAAIQPCEEPGEATVEEGYVVLDGPDGVAVTMTADAAAKTAQSLLEAATKARSASNHAGESRNEAGAA